jgi:hypothetical protein
MSPTTLQQLDAGDRGRGISEALETEHHSNALLPISHRLIPVDNL